jgi:RNA polymerase sigma-70 factor (ECF subfamily)
MLPQDKKLYESLSDEELILRFQKEDNDAFSQLVTRYKDRLVNFLFRYTGGRDEAEDIAQDTFLRLYRLKHTYKEVGKFSSWFYTIALNQAKSHKRDKLRHKAISMNQTYGEDEREMEFPSDTKLPDEDIMAEDENFYIQKAINSLEEKHKEIIILRDIQDMEYEEIASILKIPVGTVKSRINRARESLKVMLERTHKPKRISPNIKQS